MEHPIYNLGTKMKILGLEVGDLGVIAVTWYVTFLIIGAALPDRLRIIAALATTFVIFQVWIRVKDRVPSNFVPHFASWIAERPEYDVTPDLDPQPYVIDFRAVDEFHAEQRELRKVNARIKRQVGRARKAT